MTINTSNEETYNVLYEFTCVKLRIGESLVFGEESTEYQMKDGLQKMRNALWSIKEMRGTLKGKSKLSDCNSSYWSVMELYVVVLCYAGLYRIHGGTQKMSYG